MRRFLAYTQPRPARNLLRFHAGQGLERVLLTAAGRGVMAGFANQPCQVPSLRPQLARVLGLAGHPQVVVRLGYPAGCQIQDFHHIRRAQSA